MGTLHLINTRRLQHDEFVSTLPPAEFDEPRWPFEAASAVSEFGHDDPPRPQTVSLLQRLLRWVRTQQIKRMKP